MKQPPVPAKPAAPTYQEARRSYRGPWHRLLIWLGRR